MSSRALDTFRMALVAYGQQHYDDAWRLAQQAAQADPSNDVYSAAVVHLERTMQTGKPAVYGLPEAFGAFIRGGGNVHLYENTSAALRRVYEQYRSLALLDVGVGSGLALVPALTPNVGRLDILEPSAAMLAQASAALHARGIAHRAINMTAQQFIQSGAGHYDVAQATYALQALPPADRGHVLAGLRALADRLLIAEFDVPEWASSHTGLATPERVRYFVERYARGLAEYADDDDGLVVQGFLMPIFFGAFDPTEARLNWEMPIAEWARLLREAGFDRVRSELIHDYWWAASYLLDAT